MNEQLSLVRLGFAETVSTRARAKAPRGAR